MSEPGGGGPAAWHPDPYGRHEHRYWDGAAWTDQVSDGGSTGVDPPVAPAMARTPPPALPTPPVAPARRGRTWLLIGGGVAVVAALVVLGLVVLGGGDDDGGGDGEEAAGAAGPAEGEPASGARSGDEWLGEVEASCNTWFEAVTAFGSNSGSISDVHTFIGETEDFQDALLSLVPPPADYADESDELIGLLSDELGTLDAFVADLESGADAQYYLEPLSEHSRDIGELLGGIVPGCFA